MKKKGIFLIILAMAALFSMRGLDFFRAYYFVIPIDSLNSYQIPCTSIEIQGNRYQVEIDLGAKTALSLDKDVLGKIKKDLCGTSRRMDFHGNKYETHVYFIPEVKIGSLLLKKIKTKEESTKFVTESSLVIGTNEHKYAGRIGRDFFLGKNLFMDFKHRILIACSKLKDIEREGYDINTLTAVPFKSTDDGITLEIVTDIGKRKFALDSGTTVTVLRSENLNKTPIKHSNGMQFIETFRFAIGGMDLGFREIYLLDMSQEFNQIDGLLGMDFLKDHLVYLDFENQIAYIGKSQKKTNF